jgi:FkbM family methyltransferase
MNLELDETKFTQRIMLEQGSHYEQEISDLMKHLLTKEDTFIDCGANIGFFTCLGTELAGIVYAFEAEKDNIKSLKHNIKINKYENVSVFHNAVGDKCKKIELRVNLDNDGGHALWDVSKHPFNQKTLHETPQYQNVDMVTLDSIVNCPVKLIKIDVEGCEFKVLRGAEQLLKKYSPTIICEINDMALREMGTDKGEIYDFMSGLGYQGFNLTNGKGWETLNPRHCDNAVFVRADVRQRT